MERKEAYTVRTPSRITYLTDKLVAAVQVADKAGAVDAVKGRSLPSPDTRIAREYALSVKGRLLAVTGGLRPLEPWFARPAMMTEHRPSGDWDAATVAYMRENGCPGFMNRTQRRAFFPRAQRVDGTW